MKDRTARTTRTPAVLSTLLILGTLLVVGQQPQHVLDLTKLTPPVSGGGGSGCAIGGSGDTPLKLPLTVSLSLNRADYFLGGHVVYDVSIQNTGPGEIYLPWAPKSSILAVVGEDAGSRAMSLELVTLDDGGREHMLMAEILYGNRAVGDSIRTIKAGESARIRIPGWLTVPPEHAARIADPNGKERELFARVRISPGRCVWAEPIKSQPMAVLLRMNQAK